MDGANDLTQYVRQLELFRHQDHARDQMIGEILTRYEHLQRAYQEKCDDYSNEVESRRMWQTKAGTYDREMQALSKSLKTTESNPFVFVIIDGDGAVFQDMLLKAGADGGSQAGYLLHNEIMNYVSEAYPQAASQDWSVMVQIVLNLDGLAKKLHACGIISNTAAERTLSDFGRGFGRAQPLFSFIDVGSGKESADHKIRETLRLMVRINQCKHIFFGPCHDNGYLPVLEPYKLDPKVYPRLTLIETTPAEEGFKHLNFHRISFKSVFRSEKLPDRVERPSVSSVSSVSAVASPTTAGMQPLPPPVHVPTSNGNGGALLRSNTNESQPQRVASPQSSSGGAQTPTSWSVVTKVSTGKTIDISSKKPAPKKYYLLNVESQRVDEQFPRIDPNVEKRFKERMTKSGKNLCNNFHLHGFCKNGDACPFLHGEKLSQGELTLLKQKSRGIPCNDMSGCDNADCMLGHHCRWLKNCEHSSCRFQGYHDIDTKPRVKVYEDGTTQMLAA
ncbi:hypothetical protein CGCTS75_v007569 [Colletotrichum tropicale]|nr:hypothetical protein CGCTS75_v007569 [Colletotrichum tropicale]